MARDVTDLLREALPEHVGEPDLDRIDQRVRRRRAGRIGAAATAATALVVAVALGVGTARSPEIEIVDEPPASPSVEPSPSPSPTETGAAAEVVVLPEPTPIGVHQVADLPGDGFVLETERGMILVAADLSATWVLPDLVLDAWPVWVEGTAVEGTSPTEVGATDPWVVDVGPFPVVDTASSPGARWWVTPGGGFVERVGVEWVDLVAGAWVLEDVDTTPGERRRVFVGAGDDIEVLASFDETVPVAVSSDRRFVTSLADGARPFVDVDMGGVGETDPGCWFAVGLGDFAGLEICDDGGTLRAFGPDGDDEALATVEDLADAGVVRFVGAAYTDGGVLVQSGTDDGDGRVHLIGDTGPVDLGPGRLLSGRAGVDTSGGTQGEPRIALLVPTGTATHELRLLDPAAPSDHAVTTVLTLPDGAAITDARVYRYGHLWADRAAGPGSGGDEDLQAGRTFVFLRGVDVDAGTITVDEADWLSGEDARAAYEDETGDPDGPPNDYYIDNPDTTESTYPVAPDASIRVVTPDDVTTLVDGDLADVQATLERFDDRALFWLRIEDGTVTGIEWQYTP